MNERRVVERVIFHWHVIGRGGLPEQKVQH